ncbi:hypothetical protein JOF56_006934 [Kibdelosporangium banguiense]|uniref:Uncharacterized protein n=1 Tax=Kibdelosporangium banguiense TaxID=1365924 RepID=A0ABS4TQ64_9PSEU|nr:hypothetical protein [Kibdelosporangium banguiense]MBP2326549.1 hypothetical protein [Kibdelosporangium banguiense]
MTVRMENLTIRLVTVVLNSGEVLHLPPRQAVEREPVEVADNAKVQKLQDALVISVTESDKDTADTGDDTDQEATRKPTKARARRQPNT